ncbi:hypothetical protein PVAND_008932 [Polypedilum vanderplanki]|uniref:Uncharacterized protein n=1 Tax=Polypedilum vanderplanki TaxID=319348 RepID=A0A9J6CBC3_POLVA|nr:hypothetical protein PVAND_008932 [Polypedilum vanderplanki]
MWKVSFLLLVLTIHFVVTQDLQQKATISTEIKNNSTQQHTEDKNNVIKSEINHIEKEDENKPKSVNNHESTISNIQKNDNEFPVKMPTGDLNEPMNFKYYWMLLVGSSLAIIGLIVFRSFRLRKTRAEIKYGRANDSEEVQPFSKASKWEEESSENEDEIFDINFLKNTRLQTHNDV